jgi:hypothetical protein
MTIPNTGFSEIDVLEAAFHKYQTEDLSRGQVAASDDQVLLPYRRFSNGAVAVQLAGSFSGTVTFELTVDGSTWVPILGRNITTGAETTTASVEGVFRFEAVGASAFRVRALAWTSGTAAITLVGLVN